jgi:hypothetical protein
VGGVLEPTGVGSEGVVGLAEISTDMPLSMAWSITMAAVSDRPRGTVESSLESNMCSRHYLVLFRWVSGRSIL